MACGGEGTAGFLKPEDGANACRWDRWAFSPADGGENRRRKAGRSRRAKLWGVGFKVRDDSRTIRRLSGGSQSQEGKSLMGGQNWNHKVGASRLL